MATEKKYKTFWSFYPYYLTEHGDATNRTLHFLGTLGLLVILVTAVALQKWWMLALIPVCGYGFAWVGHFFVEKNRPATFTYPFYSLASDFVMFWHMLTGQINKKLEEASRVISE
ncbi:MAG: DUF962 domain-containing protein [Chitinophagaceae bacterium]|nr:DUF962 domain-containing protein [Chitinophagaceae bacterium]